MTNQDIKKICTFCFAIFFGLHIYAQQVNDSVLTARDFIALVKENHPLAKVADLQLEQAMANFMVAKGGFDPVLKAGTDQKTFDGKDYFQHSKGELIIPTPVGIDVKAGIENNEGNYLNREITPGNMGSFGVAIPLGKGLFFDQRRATLQQARIFNELSRQERLQILNDLVFNAYTDYVQWAGAYQLYKVYNGFTELAAARLRLVKIGYENGDRSVSDTIEAYTQLQTYEMSQAEALVRLNKARFQLANYLWGDNNTTYQLSPAAIPDLAYLNAINPLPPVQYFLQASDSANPVLRSYTYKLQNLVVERRLKFQSLLPTLDASANILNKSYNSFKGVDPLFFQNNNKWSVTFKLPLFLREARGNYRLANIKIMETDLAFAQKRRETENKIQSYYAENIVLKKQIKLAETLNDNYAVLLRNENLKFNQGESSLFVVNSREMKFLEIVQKLTELKIKYAVSALGVRWSAGISR